MISNRMVVLGLELQAIESALGVITADDLVARAKDPESPLFTEFEWDDTKAGHAYRLAQARQLIREYRVWINVKVGEDIETKVRVSEYVRDPDTRASEQGYIRLSILREDADAARRAVYYELGRAASYCRRALAIAAVLDVHDALSDLTARIERVRKTLQPDAQAGEEEAA